MVVAMKDYSCNIHKILQAWTRRACVCVCCCWLHDSEHLDYFKTRARQRRWNVISPHSLLEKKYGGLMSASGTAAARHCNPSPVEPQLKAAEPSPSSPGQILSRMNCLLPSLQFDSHLLFSFLFFFFIPQGLVFSQIQRRREGFFFWPHISHLPDYINVLPCLYWWPAALLTSIYWSVRLANEQADC